jgi:hypothetical protein
MNKVTFPATRYNTSVLISIAFERKKVLDETSLKEWLGDRSTIDPLTSTPVGESATRRDPKCRFMWVLNWIASSP